MSDAGPLIGLAIINALPLVNELFRAIMIPEAVAQELHLESDMPGARALAVAKEQGWLQIMPVGDVPDHLLVVVDRGEAEAITLAKQKALPLLIDESRGRLAARNESVAVFGLGALLLRAKERRLVPAVSPYLSALTAAQYRISKQQQVEILRQADEFGATG